MKMTRPVLLAAAAILTLNFVFSRFPAEALVAALKALGVLAAVYLNGFWLLRLGCRKGGSQNFLDVLGMGIIATTAYFFLLSFARLLTPWAIGLYFLPPIAVCLWLFKKRGLRQDLLGGLQVLWQRSPWEWAVFFLPLLYAILPTAFFDTLAYNSALSNFFLQNGGFVKTPQFMFANGFIYHEIFQIPAVFCGDAVPRLLHFFIGVLFLLAVVDFGCREFGLRKRFALLLVLVSLPMTLFLITTEKADLITALFIFLAVRKYRARRFAFSALYWGFAIGCKSFSILAAAAFFLAAILLEGKLEAKRHAMMLAVILLALLPLLAKNGLFAGNPFFPFFSRRFANEFWDASRERLVLADLGARIHSWRDLLRAPYEFSFKSMGAGSFVGPVFLIFLPFLLFLKMGRERRIYLLFPLLLIFGSSFFGNAMRYVYIAFVLLAILVAAVYEEQGRGLLRLALPVVILANLAAGWFTLEAIYEAKRFYYGNMSLEEYKASVFPMYAAYRAVNERTPRGTRVLVAGETRGYYLRRPHTIGSAYDYSVLKKYLARAASAGEFAAAMRADGYDYLLFDSAEFVRLAQRYRQLTREETDKLLGFLRGLRPASIERSTYTYRLR